MKISITVIRRKVRLQKTITMFIGFCLLSFFLRGISLSGTIDLPQTGQTSCWDSDGNSCDCRGTGQDGDILAGVEWPSPRFTDNNDGTITDNLTGLMWLKNADYFGSQSWSNAVSNCYALNICGYDDWFLPNIIELMSLVGNPEYSDPGWLSAHGFQNVQSYYYWSSTTFAADTIVAWVAGNGAYGNIKEAPFSVWPVRSASVDGQKAMVWKTGQTKSYLDNDDGSQQSGVAWPSIRFTDNEDGTVTDHLTGLVWLKDWSFCGEKTWTNALVYVNALELAGYKDWRLPNRRELFSLVDFAKHDPCLPAENPFINIQMVYWTSSSSASYTNYAWCLNTNSGHLYHTRKSLSRYTLPVRGGKQVKNNNAPQTEYLFLLLGD